MAHKILVLIFLSVKAWYESLETNTVIWVKVNSFIIIPILIKFVFRENRSDINLLILL